jgi:hypothetical protein
LKGAPLAKLQKLKVEADGTYVETHSAGAAVRMGVD